MVSLLDVAVVFGPALALIVRRSRRALGFFDGVCVSVVLGFSALFLIPRALNQTGLLGLVGVALGLFVAAVLQRRALSNSTASIMVAGLLSLFLTSHSWGTQGVTIPLAFDLGVRLVAGLTLSHFVLSRMGALGMVTATTALLSVSLLAARMEPPVIASAWVEAIPFIQTFATGLMIRSLVTGPTAMGTKKSSDQTHGHSHGHAHGHSHGHAHGHDDSPGGFTRQLEVHATALGALSVVFVFAVFYVLSHGATDPTMAIVLNTLGVLALESAPALVFGYALAGLVPQLLSHESVGRLSQGSRFWQACRGVVFGLPLPVCSCGVLPIYESLARRGVPLAAGLAFFVATPELGLDAVLLSVPMLGMPLTVARVISAGLVALLVGVLVGQIQARKPDVIEEESNDSSAGSWRVRVTRGLKFGFVDMFDHTMPWIAFGLLLASIAEPLLSHESLSSLSPSLQVPLSALVGVPLYVCASGATPLVAMSLHKGLSSGAALAFLIAGPATNVTTFGVLARLHGRRLAFGFGAAVTGLAMIAGWMVDGWGVVAQPVIATHAEIEGSWLQWGCFATLVVLTLASLFRQGPRGVLGQLLEPIHAH